MRSALGQVFDPRENALNAWRLVLAAGVILQHSWPLTGRELATPFTGLLTQVWVDAFFVVSGFLITGSWLNNPRLREYAVARALRIFPGLWVCLLVVAFVLAPIGAALSGGSLRLSSQIAYVLNNAVLNIYYTGIDETPMNVPWPGVWDGPLWTLIFEVMCYIGVAILGVAGLLRRRWTVPVVFVLGVAGSAVVGYPVMSVETIPQMMLRFIVVFSAGALVYQYRDRIPARWWLVAVCAALVVVLGLLPNYRVYAALPLAYAVIVSGALLKRPRLRNDLSYGMYIYAWPVQQLLAAAGLVWLDPRLFFVVATLCTVPLAAASWFVVERQAMKLKRRVRRKEFAESAPGG
ncbi:acyltransferase [Mycobacterium barrassiae]|uniref:acyltransferase family protein n=1 Tax=Mycobacterium barrassiae TaxID=319709 RepID=UPI002265F919|nr:acyltransferase [Mycobacterium barrassiae]MCV7299514.1 acyltransferase [Mycobacterium barrassiae]